MKEKFLNVKEKFFKRSNLIILLASFLIPAAFLTVVYAVLGFYPFGNKSVLIMDMADQYNDFFASLRYMFNGDNTPLFSWSRSMGGNYVGLFAYYIASPLSFFTLFFSLENLPVALFILTLVKTGLCGLTFAIYLQYGWNHGKGKFKNIVFTCCYALMSYVIVYSMCLMWLDGLILLPLILLGVEQLIKGKKGLLFFLALTGSFICNYYIAYMVGIFTFLYLLYRMWCSFEKSEVKKALAVFAKFAANVIMAFLLSAPLTLTTLKDLLSGKLMLDPKIEKSTYYNLWQLIDRLFGGYDGITDVGRPSIFCGTLILVLVVMFFFMKKINWKEKVGAALIFLIFILSFWIVKLNIIWHGFAPSTWFPFRYAFLCSTFMIIVAYRTSEVFVVPDRAKRRMAVPVTVYLTAMVLLFTGVELYVNAKANIVGLDNQFGYKSMEQYRGFLKKMKPVVKEVQTRDSGFYRMKKDQSSEFSKNDAMLLGYNGMTHYSSVFHNGVNVFTSQLGMAQISNWNSGYGTTPVLDSIFNVKYCMMTTDMPEMYKDTGIGNEDVKVYENTNVLPIAFSSGKIDTIDLSDENNFKNQNKLLNALAGTKNEQYFKPVKHDTTYSDLKARYTWNAENKNPVYVRLTGVGYGLAEVKANNKYMGNQFTSETSCNLFVGQFEKGEDVKVTCHSENVIPENELVYEMDLEAYDGMMQKLNAGALKITKQKGSTIEGEIEVGQNQMIFTSIPYDEGFTVKVDGKEVELTSLKLKDNGKDIDVFLTIMAEPGRHEIQITYMPPGLLAGLAMAVVGIVAAVLYYGFSRLKEKTDGKKVKEKEHK